MPMKPIPIRLSDKHLERLEAIAAACDFTKQELIRIALDRLFDRLDAGEEFVEQRILSLRKKSPGEKQTLLQGTENKTPASAIRIGGKH